MKTLTITLVILGMGITCGFSQTMLDPNGAPIYRIAKGEIDKDDYSYDIFRLEDDQLMGIYMKSDSKFSFYNSNLELVFYGVINTYNGYTYYSPAYDILGHSKTENGITQFYDKNAQPQYFISPTFPEGLAFCKNSDPSLTWKVIPESPNTVATPECAIFFHLMAMGVFK